VERPSPSTLYGKVDFIIRNQVDDMVLMRGICHVSKGEKDGNFNTMILPRRSASMRVKASLLSAGGTECCLVYELIDQRNEHKPIMEYHQVFIAVRMFAIPLIRKYKAAAVMFMARKGQFTDSKDNMKRLKGILREHLVNNEYSFRCNIKSQTLRLKAIFHRSRQAIEVILKETDGHVENGPIPY
jgi:hypothetical protein